MATVRDFLVIDPTPVVSEIQRPIGKLFRLGGQKHFEVLTSPDMIIRETVRIEPGTRVTVANTVVFWLSLDGVTCRRFGCGHLGSNLSRRVMCGEEGEVIDVCLFAYKENGWSEVYDAKAIVRFDDGRVVTMGVERLLPPAPRFSGKVWIVSEDRFKNMTSYNPPWGGVWDNCQ